LYVRVFSPTLIFDKAIFEFGDDALSKPLEFDVSLNNKGDRKSESLTRVTLMFDKTVEVSLKSSRFWEEKKDTQNIKIFNYLKDDVVINPSTSRYIGKYELRIPPKQAEPLLFALFMIEGDFKRKTVLVYYDYLNEKYNVDHYKDVDRALEIWNNR
jgi:hypothetical protein